MRHRRVFRRPARVFRLRHPRWKAVRVAFLLAAIPFLYPDLLPLLPAPATQFLSGALLLIPLGAAIEVAMEYITHRLYLFHRLHAPLQHVTEDAAEAYARSRSQFVGGFIHAFVGNLAFLILTGTVLVSAASAGEETRRELVGVVLSSIAGNLVINILLILGLATFIGGLLHKGIPYDKDTANAYAEMLTLAVIALGLPTLAYRLNLSVGFGGQIFHLSGGEAAQLSDITATVLIFVFVGYTLYTVFGFRASHLTESPAVSPAVPPGAGSNAPASESGDPGGANLALDATETSAMPKRSLRSVRSFVYFVGALVCVVGIGVCVVWISEHMASALEDGLSEGFLPGIPLNAFFVGFILLPFASHIEELLAAITLATHTEPAEPGSTTRNGPPMETCQGLTIGSSIQVALLVAPALVLVGHLYGIEEMNLIFSPFILAIFGLMVFLLQVNVFDGKTDWLEGLEMITFFGLLACVAFLAVS